MGGYIVLDYKLVGMDPDDTLMATADNIVPSHTHDSIIGMQYLNTSVAIRMVPLPKESSESGTSSHILEG